MKLINFNSYKIIVKSSVFIADGETYPNPDK